MQFFHPRKDPRSEWHSWFAWRPVRLKPGDGSDNPVVWLEWIERRVETLCDHRSTYYRKPQQKYVWQNVYPNGVTFEYLTRERADERAGDERLCVRKVAWPLTDIDRLPPLPSPSPGEST